MFTFIIGIQNEQFHQSRTLFQFNNGARFALRKKQYRINEEQIAFLVEERHWEIDYRKIIGIYKIKLKNRKKDVRAR